MDSDFQTRWRGLRPEGFEALAQRDYAQGGFARSVAETGIETRELVAADRSKPEVAEVWIPGVEFFHRKIYLQRHRGFFAEMARIEEGVLGQIKLRPRQWATARMFANTAKGFHIHPPHIPDGEEPGAWFKRLYVERPTDFELRPYEKEQWDVMFFVQGVAEMILSDERAGLPRRRMRFYIDGDDRRGADNVAVVIPPGVAHALRVEGSDDLIMVYGTSTVFSPDFEGRIAAAVELAPLPPAWQDYLR